MWICRFKLKYDDKPVEFFIDEDLVNNQRPDDFDAYLEVMKLVRRKVLERIEKLGDKNIPASLAKLEFYPAHEKYTTYRRSL